MFEITCSKCGSPLIYSYYYHDTGCDKGDKVIKVFECETCNSNRLNGGNGNVEHNA